MDYNEKTIEEKHIYKGNIIDIYKMTVTLPDGRTATRDIVRHPGAAVVIPYSDGSLYLVKQFRKPIDKCTLELPAGKLDNNEDPFECAVRELKEETGLESDNIRHLISVHSTPGFSDEILHVYLATDLREGDSCCDPDEFISTLKLPVGELIKMVLNGEITDSKTIIGIMFADKISKGELNA